MAFGRSHAEGSLVLRAEPGGDWTWQVHIVHSRGGGKRQAIDVRSQHDCVAYPWKSADPPSAKTFPSRVAVPAAAVGVGVDSGSSSATGGGSGSRQQQQQHLLLSQ